MISAAASTNGEGYARGEAFARGERGPRDAGLGAANAPSTSLKKLSSAESSRGCYPRGDLPRRNPTTVRARLHP